MISEAIDMLTLTKVIAYETDAMSEVHKAPFISELAMNRISILEKYYHFKAPALNSTTSNPTHPPSFAAGDITQKIWGKLIKEDRP